MDKKVFTIKRERFVDWYFNTGADQDQEKERLNIGYLAVESLKSEGYFTYSVADVFRDCDHSTVPISYTEQSDEHGSMELGDVGCDFELYLIW